MPSSGETSEDIAIASSVDKSGFLLGGGLNVVFPHEELQSAFIAIELSYGTPHNALAKRAQGKSVVHLYNEDLKQVSISFPSTDEQAKISSFFDNIDNLITLHLREFTKSNSSIFVSVSIYANGLPAAWELRKLGECFDERQERSAEGELISVTINDGIRRFSELGRHNNSSDDKSHYKKVEVGDIAYNSMRMWQGASGYSPYSGILSPAYTVVIPKSDVDSLFFSYVFKKPQMIHTFQISSQGITSDTWNLKYPAFSEIETTLPKIEEQKKIAEYFRNLDNLITLHLRKYSELFL